MRIQPTVPQKEEIFHVDLDIIKASPFPPPPPIVFTISYVQQQTTPIPTPPITTEAPPITTTVPDPLPTIVKRVSELEKDVKELKQDEDDLDKVIPDLRKRDREEDEDPSAESNQRKKKRRSGKDSEPSKTSSASKETSKGDTPPKSSKTSKSASAEESVKEATHEATPKNNWFKQPPRPPTPDPEWNSCQVIDDQLEQPWFNNRLSAQKDPLTFEELMATPIDFSNFAKNRFKLNKITKADLVGPVYNLLKRRCQSSIELEYNMEECFKALTDRLDWENLKGDRCPFDLSKPLPLKGRPGHLTVASERFFNNDLEYLKFTNFERKYTTSITKLKAVRFSKHTVYSALKILSVVSVKVGKLHGYGYLEEIVVRRADRQMYMFKEGDFVNLHLNDIEDMLLLVVHHKLFNLDGEVIVDLAVVLRISQVQ
ncbi:hypothetical protein Tco_0184621 [Tanacetum coccineum]